MSARIRRRKDPNRKTVSIKEATESVRHRRAVERMIAAESSRILPSDAQLDEMATVRPKDVAYAVDLWDEAQQVAGTGLEGMLDARLVDSAE